MSSLFQRFILGSHEAFNIYYHRYNRRVYASLLRLCGNEDLAEELTQQVFVDLWAKRADINDETHLENRLFLLAKGFFHKHLRDEEKAHEAEGVAGNLRDPFEAAFRFALEKEKVMAAVEEE